MWRRSRGRSGGFTGARGSGAHLLVGLDELAAEARASALHELPRGLRRGIERVRRGGRHGERLVRLFVFSPNPARAILSSCQNKIFLTVGGHTLGHGVTRTTQSEVAPDSWETPLASCLCSSPVTRISTRPRRRSSTAPLLTHPRRRPRLPQQTGGAPEAPRRGRRARCVRGVLAQDHRGVRGGSP